MDKTEEPLSGFPLYLEVLSKRLHETPSLSHRESRELGFTQPLMEQFALIVYFFINLQITCNFSKMAFSGLRELM